MRASQAGTARWASGRAPGRVGEVSGASRERRRAKLTWTSGRIGAASALRHQRSSSSRRYRAETCSRKLSDSSPRTKARSPSSSNATSSSSGPITSTKAPWVSSSYSVDSTTRSDTALSLPNRSLVGGRRRRVALPVELDGALSCSTSRGLACLIVSLPLLECASCLGNRSRKSSDTGRGHVLAVGAVDLQGGAAYRPGDFDVAIPSDHWRRGSQTLSALGGTSVVFISPVYSTADPPA